MENPPQISLSELLHRLSELGGSDLHVTTGTPPLVRVHGEIRPLDGYRPLTASETKQLAYSVLTDAQKHRFEENLELDFSFGVKGLSRFRANIFNQRGAVGAVFRAIPYEIRSFDELGLPPVVKDLCNKPRGLVLVTGPTGSGKSTTLAAVIDKINKERHEHILTIEDPIEFLHNHKSCTMQQAQVRAQLSLTLEGILCQSLLPKADGRGRALAMEILIPNSAIRNLIREDKVHQIYSMMQTGQDIHGMQTFNQSLATLFHKRQITRETAMQRTSNVNELRDLIDRGAGINNGNGAQPRPGAPPAYNQTGRVLSRK